MHTNRNPYRPKQFAAAAVLFATGIALVSAGMPLHRLFAVLMPICALGFWISAMAALVGFLHGRTLSEFDRRLTFIEEPCREIRLLYPGWTWPLAASLLIAFVILRVSEMWGSSLLLYLSYTVPLICLGLVAGFGSKVVLRSDTISVGKSLGTPRSWQYSQIVNMKGRTAIAITFQDGTRVDIRPYPFSSLEFYLAVEARCGRDFGSEPPPTTDVVSS